ncbi:MAG TPA: metallophosphoesterase [Virgibacillus sp.]|nr:metallophosphoesterase [Virgibacillus sp.]
MADVLIISDSHGLREEIQMIKKRHNADVLIHCGDSELPADAKELDDFVKVAGNCDLDRRYSNEEWHVIENFNFFVTHGHLNQVKSSLLPLTYRANEVNAHVICFGHTHIAGSEKIDDRLYVNPGSIKMPKGEYGKTYTVLSCSHVNEIDVTFYSLNGEKIKALSNHYTLR